MSEIDLRGVVDTVRAALSGRAILADDVDAGYLIDQHMQLAVLDKYREEFDRISEDADSIAWLVRRTAEIEARLLTLEKILVSGLPLRQGPAEISERGKISPGADSVLSDGLAATGDEPAGVDGAETYGADITAATKPDAQVFVEQELYKVLFDRDMAQNGFYDAELGGGRRWFRWLGPETRATVFLPKFEGPVRIVLKVVAIYPENALANVQISLDGGEWVACEISAEEGATLLTAVPPRGTAFQDSNLQVDIDCGVTASPADDGRPDDRKLGIAICSLHLYSLQVV